MAGTSVQDALRESGVNMRVIAEDAELSYHQVRRWAAGMRTPQPENVQQLAVGLRRRAARLEELADAVEELADAVEGQAGQQ